MLMPTSGRAADSTYTMVTTGSWSDTSKWTLAGGPGNTPAYPNAPGDVVQRLAGSSSTMTQDIALGVTVGTFSIAGTVSNSITFGDSTNTITLNQDGAGAGSATIINSATTAAGRMAFTAPLILADDLNVTNNNANSTSAGGSISFVTTSPISGTGNMTFNNVLNSTTAGFIAVNSAAGTPNTFTGTVTIGSGAVNTNSNAAFGNIATNTIVLGKTGGGNATLNISTAGAGTFANNVVVAANTGGTTLLTSTASAVSSGASFSGTVTMNGDLSMSAPNLTVNSRFTLSGPVSGVGGFTSVAGNIQLTGSNTFSGATRVNSGTLFLGASGNTTYALQNSTLDMNGGDTGTVNFGVSTSTTINAATIGGLSGSRNLALQNMRTVPTAVNLTLGTNNTNQTYTGQLTGTATVTKVGTGTQTFGGANMYTGTTTVNAGTLIISSAGSLASAGINVAGGKFVYNNNTTPYAGNVAVSGAVGGSGRINGQLSGSGMVGPGNSPGVLTVGSLNTSGGMDFSFEFTSTGSPAYGNNTASVNDVLRITDATPFTASLTSANVINVYLDVAALGFGDVFTGGFFTDTNANFLSTINGATYVYYLYNAAGSVSYEGNTYNLYAGPLNFDVTTVAQTADFGGGNINGYVTQFTAVPEPQTCVLFGLGLGALLWRNRSRRRN